MAPGVRQRSRRSWPRGLEEVRPGYYRWRPPSDVRPLIDATIPEGGFVLGQIPLKDAIEQVVMAMRKLYGTQKRTLVDAIDARPESVSAWIPQYLDRVQKRLVADETVNNAGRRLGKLPEEISRISMREVSTRHIADYLATLSNTPRTQQSVRSLLLDFFREAIAAK